MGHVQPADPFTQHYLEIQALSPVDIVQTDPLINKQTSGIFLTLPIILIMLLFVGVFGWQLYTRIKELNRILMILVFGLLVGTIPLTVNMLNTRSTDMATKARYDYAPQTVVIDEVSSTGFTISWKTKVPTLGAVKISTSRTMDQDMLVLREAKSNLTHTLVVTGLKPNTTYYVELYSDTRWYNYNGGPLIITTSK